MIEQKKWLSNLYELNFAAAVNRLAVSNPLDGRRWLAAYATRPFERIAFGDFLRDKPANKIWSRRSL